MSWTATAEVKNLIKETGSRNSRVAYAALEKVAIALEPVLRKGVQSGDVVDGLFERVDAPGCTTVEYPLHFLKPGTEDEMVAFTMPGHGYIPQRIVEGDYVNIPTYDIVGAVDWDIKYARQPHGINIVQEATEVLRGQFVKKKNDDGWATIIAAGNARNIIVADADSPAGQFSVRLASVMKTVVRRNGGGNSTSLNRSKLTDLFLSPEGFEDIRGWNVDQLDEVSRREIYTAPDGMLNRIFQVNLHDLDELGEGQQYQLYYTSNLGGSLPNAGNQKLELCVGLDLSRRNSFIMPVSEDLEIMVDDTKLRSRMSGLFGHMALGFAVLDTRTVLLGAF